MGIKSWLGLDRPQIPPQVLDVPRAPNGSPIVPIHEDAMRLDNWQNNFTGLGTPRDKMMAGSFWTPIRIMDTELLAIYNGSDLGARIVETKPKEMMRRGYSIEIDGDDEADEEDLAALMKQGEKLRLNDRVTDSGVWGNLFGGALLIIGAQDGGQMDQPLNEKNISTIRYLNMIDRRFIYVNSYYKDQLAPNFGEPETYLIVNSIGGSTSGTSSTSTVVVHESRVLRFDGARTDRLTSLQLAGWSWSLLQRAYEPLRAFEASFQAVNNLMSDASQAVFKIQNLISMLASGEKGNLQTRMALVDQSRSVCRAVLLDAENEEFERQATSFAGLPDLLDRFMMRLSAAVEIPVAILLGRSAAGMNATGDSDFRAFYDAIASEQENSLAPKLKRLYHLMALAKDSALKGDYEFKIKFNGLWQPSDTEQATIELNAAQKDQIYVTIGAITAEEVALSRWGKNGFTGTGMNAFKPEDAMASQDNEKMFGAMLNPPQELQAKTAKGADQMTAQAALQGQQQENQPPAGAPIGAGASPFGGTKNPISVMANLHKPPKPPTSGQ